MDAVTQERAGAQQAETAVDIGVALGFWKELAHPSQLLQILCQVGLDEGIVGLGQPPCSEHEFSGTAGGETGRERVAQAPAIPSMPGATEFLALAQAGFCVFAQGLRRMAIHHGLADDGADAAGFSLPEDGVRGLGMDGGVQNRRGGA